MSARPVHRIEALFPRVRHIGFVLTLLSLMAIQVPSALGAAAQPAGSAQWTAPGPGMVANETGAAGKDIYIVRHQAPSLAQYTGGIAGLAATSPEATGAARLNPNSNASKAYLAYLDGVHDGLIAAIESELGQNVEVTNRYEAAYNGLAVRLTPQGEGGGAVASLPGVALI